MNAVIWSKPQCPYCEQAKALLTNRGYTVEEKKIGNGYTKEQLLESVPSARSVPQIYINGEYVGGYTELKMRLSVAA